MKIMHTLLHSKAARNHLECTHYMTSCHLRMFKLEIKVRRRAWSGAIPQKTVCNYSSAGGRNSACVTCNHRFKAERLWRGLLFNGIAEISCTFILAWSYCTCSKKIRHLYKNWWLALKCFLLRLRRRAIRPSGCHRGSSALASRRAIHCCRKRTNSMDALQSCIHATGKHRDFIFFFPPLCCEDLMHALLPAA